MLKSFRRWRMRGEIPAPERLAILPGGQNWAPPEVGELEAGPDHDEDQDAHQDEEDVEESHNPLPHRAVADTHFDRTRLEGLASSAGAR